MNIARGFFSAAFAAALLVGVAPVRAADEGWNWYVAPYMWASSLSIDLTTPQGSVEGNADFSDIVDKLEGAFLGHVEGQGDHFGMFADVIYMKLGDSNDGDIASVDADMQATIAELAAVYSPSPERYQGLDLFAGLRYIDLELDVEIDPNDPAIGTRTVDAGESFSDFLLGARYTAHLSDKWGLTVRGDGSFGDTEGTWSASAMFEYRTGRGAWVFGYRYMDVELQPNTNTVEMAMYGPVVGFAWAL